MKRVFLSFLFCFLTFLPDFFAVFFVFFAHFSRFFGGHFVSKIGEIVRNSVVLSIAQQPSLGAQQKKNWQRYCCPSGEP